MNIALVKQVYLVKTPAGVTLAAKLFTYEERIKGMKEIVNNIKIKDSPCINKMTRGVMFYAHMPSVIISG